MKWAEDIKGKRFAIFGEVEPWPRFLGVSPKVAVERRGGVLCDKVDPSVNYVVIGSKRGKGRADAERKAKKFESEGVVRLDDAGIAHLLRPDLDGATFVFAGSFKVVGGAGSAPEDMVSSFGGVVSDEVDDDTDYVVVGGVKKGRAAITKAAEKRYEAGQALEMISESDFLELARTQRPAGKSSGIGELIATMHGLVNEKKLQKAIKMLKTESMKLYSDADDDRLVGIVRSQTGVGVYTTKIAADGTYCCADEDLGPCWGLQGAICKHILVLTIGLVQGGALSASNAEQFIRAGASKRPKHDEDALADTVLRYKAAAAGEIDWRPTETVPEDFYAY